MRVLRSAFPLLALVAVVSCSKTAASPSGSSTAAESSAAPAAASQTLSLTYKSPTVGADVVAKATGLPAGKTVDLTWATVTGGWVVEDYYRFRGKKYEDATISLGTFTVDSAGVLDARFTIPEDYGGVHEVLALIDGKPVAQNGIEVTQSFELTPASGPVGTPIELRVKGLGWRTMESTWVINWDNQEAGWVSAADTHGTAVGRIRASGTVGDHQLKVLTGYMGQGYLNHEQAPNAYLPRPSFTFRLTAGRMAPSAYAEPYQKQPVPASEASSEDGIVSIAPAQGPVRSRAMLNARGLPANAQVSIVWGTQEGSRVSGNGFAPKEVELKKATIGGDGHLDLPLDVPDDLGGRHSVSIRSGGNTLARTYFVVETSVVSMSPMSGPAGTPVTIHLKGVGWTDYDNIYIANYDNGYMGYACGFNSQGDVVVNFTATGAPGIHLIDFYPGIYQGPEGMQQLYRLPQLTYADDHPGNHIPALRFAFEVTASH